MRSRFRVPFEKSGPCIKRLRYLRLLSGVFGALLFFSCANIGQSAACRQFAECANDLDAIKGMNTNITRFEPGGGCWGSQAGFELCTGACERGLEVIRKTEAVVPASCSQ